MNIKAFFCNKTMITGLIFFLLLIFLLTKFTYIISVSTVHQIFFVIADYTWLMVIFLFIGFILWCFAEN